MIKLGVCPICGGIVQITLEQLYLRKSHKGRNKEFVERELRQCIKCKWYRFSAR